ncbi:head GIN domain-containing protein [Aquimarina gracilis]|uniref:Head GIN domain-containing protein n=1 Tax=Aquimarina gracilis TaxID=874422 RepID=A0ABU6A151_9FLAO|nr:head GIN domain-containing protein [Aquimarina gracilis]MEB3347795.1 head GIN domain-containing protein [Aquimarina gracilis]
MKKLMFITAFILAATIQAQDVITKNVRDFNELKVFDKIQVTLIKGNENRVEVTGIKRREVDVVQNGSLLKIRMSLDNIWDNNNTKVTVYYTQINKIDVNEGARVKAKGVISAENLDLRAQEGASIRAEVEAGFIFAKAITGGEIEIKGEAKEQEVTITSGGQYYASNLRTKDTQVKVSAGGTAEVNAQNYMKANTNAGGTIRIYGNPREMDTQKLLGGKIIEVN